MVRIDFKAEHLSIEAYRRLEIGDVEHDVAELSDLELERRLVRHLGITSRRAGRYCVARV